MIELLNFFFCSVYSNISLGGWVREFSTDTILATALVLLFSRVAKGSWFNLKLALS